MALFTDPPHLAMAAGQDLIRRESAIFGGMPLMGQLRIERCQVGLPRQRNFPCTDGTAGSAACAGMYGRLPAVSLLTAPPHFLFAAVGELRWSQWQIACDIPLPQKFLSTCAQAIVGQCFPQRLTPEYHKISILTYKAF